MTDLFGSNFWQSTRRLGRMRMPGQPDIQPMPGEQPQMGYQPHQPQQQRQKSIFDSMRQQKQAHNPFGIFDDTPDLVRPKVPIKPGYAGIL